MTHFANTMPGPTPAFRRRIVIASHGQGTSTLVRAAVEDDFHHFRVEVRCSGGLVEHVSGEAPRHPYTLCKSATAELTRLVGMPLSATAHEVTRFTDATEQCTHLLDLAGLAIAAAARGTTNRLYDIEVPHRLEHGRTHPRLWRDGTLLLEWDVADATIEGPAPYAGINLRHGMARWALSTLPAEEAEAALVLRRATVISVGRTKNLDAQVHAVANGSCFAHQPRRAEQALRVVGSTLDFSASGEPLCAADRSWLRERSPDSGCPAPPDRG